MRTSRAGAKEPLRKKKGKKKKKKKKKKKDYTFSPFLLDQPCYTAICKLIYLVQIAACQISRAIAMTVRRALFSSSGMDWAGALWRALPPRLQLLGQQACPRHAAKFGPPGLAPLPACWVGLLLAWSWGVARDGAGCSAQPWLGCSVPQTQPQGTTSPGRLGSLAQLGAEQRIGGRRACSLFDLNTTAAALLCSLLRDTLPP